MSPDARLSPSPNAEDARRESFEAVVAEVYEPLQRYLRRRCSPGDVDDVLNDTLFTIWRRLDDIPNQMILAWSYGVARRCLANQRRGTTRRLRLVRRVESVTSTRPADNWSGEADARLHQALAGLPEIDREVVRLWAWEQLEPREIAEVLDTTANAISVRLGRIRRRLESDMADKFHTARQNPAAAGHKPDEGHPEQEP